LFLTFLTNPQRILDSHSTLVRISHISEPQKRILQRIHYHHLALAPIQCPNASKANLDNESHMLAARACTSSIFDFHTSFQGANARLRPSITLRRFLAALHFRPAFQAANSPFFLCHLHSASPSKSSTSSTTSHHLSHSSKLISSPSTFSSVLPDPLGWEVTVEEF
jgi:hypothetical protein